MNDPLEGIAQVGIWPGMDHDFRRDDWEVGFNAFSPNSSVPLVSRGREWHRFPGAGRK